MDGKSTRITNEVDFYAKRGLRSLYIQVCSDLTNKETRFREIRPFLKLKDQVQKVLIVNKPIDESRDENEFTIIGITDFLLHFIK